MALPVSFYSSTLADNTVKGNGEPEMGNWQVPVTTLTAANYVAQRALIVNLDTAVSAITVGNPIRFAITIDREEVGSGPAASQLAQRENKWLCRYHGNTLNQKFQVSIPTADLTVLPNHSEFLDLTASPGSDLKTAFEAIVKSPDDGAETVTLDSVQYVARNT